MKWYFTDNCYWDDETSQIFRDEQIVKLSNEQSIVLFHLLRNSGRKISPAELYLKMTEGIDPDRDPNYKVKVSQKFTRDKANERGILSRLPELTPYWSRSKAGDGWYQVTLPDSCLRQSRQPLQNNEGFNKEIWYSEAFWDSVSKRNDDPTWIRKKYRLFLQGEPCSWPLFFSSPDATPVKREVVKDLIERIDDGHGAIALTGAGGEGKTTVLMQLCSDLYRDGRHVFFHAPTNKYDYPDCNDTCIFVIDNPNSSREFRSFIERAVNEGHCVVFSLRSNEWAIFRETLGSNIQRSVLEVEMPKLSLDEAGAFAISIKSHLHWVTRSEQELKGLFYRDSYGFLYASMLMAIHNVDSLEKIAEEIISRIHKFSNGDSVVYVLAAIVFAEKCGVLIGKRYYRQICQKFNVDERDARFYLRMEVSLNGTVYQTRHDSISRLFYRYLFDEVDGQNYLYEDVQDEIIGCLIETVLKEYDSLARDLHPSDPRVFATARLMQNAIVATENDETKLYWLQRMVESCRQHAFAVLEITYHYLADVDFELRCTLARKCYEMYIPVWEVYRHWLTEIVDREDSAYIARCYEQLCINNNAPAVLWLQWAAFAEQQKNIGEYRVVHSAAWLLQTACENYPDNGYAWLEWSRFVQRNTHVPELQTPTASSILREACLKHGISIEHVWEAWAMEEESLGNIGDYQTIGSAAWILHELCMVKKTANSGSGWIRWSRLVEKHPQLLCLPDGQRSYTSYDILQIACLEENADSSVWSIWAAKALAEENVGDYRSVGTAAWLLKESCTKHNPNNDPVLWERWASLASAHPMTNVEEDGSERSYTQAAVLRMACIEHKIMNSQLWAKWGRAEEALGNLGGYGVPYSAAWIYMEGCSRRMDQDHTIWHAWASFIERNPQFAHSNESLSPSSILKSNCLDYDVPPHAWIAWAIVEEEIGNVGTYESKYSAAWIYRQSCTAQATHSTARALLKWAQFALRHPLELDGITITAQYVLRYAEEHHPAFLNEQWSELMEFKKEIGY